MSSTPITPPLVEIKWNDIASHSGWMSLEEGEDSSTMNCTSVGYLIKKTRRMITLAQSIAECGDVGEILCVPVSVIQELREL